MLGVSALDLAKIPTARATSRRSGQDDIREIPILLIDTPDLEKVGSTYHFQIEDLNKDLLVVRQKRGTFLAIDIKCTHKGCDVGYDAENTCYLCPCHESRYEFDGTIRNGPAERPLQSYKTSYNSEIEEVIIYIPVPEGTL